MNVSAGVCPRFFFLEVFSICYQSFSMKTYRNPSQNVPKVPSRTSLHGFPGRLSSSFTSSLCEILAEDLLGISFGVFYRVSLGFPRNTLPVVSPGISLDVVLDFLLEFL